jgi:hypothetical protein
MKLKMGPATLAGGRESCGKGASARGPRGSEDLFGIGAGPVGPGGIGLDGSWLAVPRGRGGVQGGRKGLS